VRHYLFKFVSKRVKHAAENYQLSSRPGKTIQGHSRCLQTTGQLASQLSAAATIPAIIPAAAPGG